MPDLTLAERLKARYTTQRRRFEVPELADLNGTPGPLVFYADLFTLADEQAIGPYLTADDAEGYAQIWKLKALTADGKPLFSEEGDLHALMRYVDHTVVKRVAMDIYAAPTQSEAVGNYSLTPDSGVDSSSPEA